VTDFVSLTMDKFPGKGGRLGRHVPISWKKSMVTLLEVAILAYM
jgi:hypothetical protein